MNLRIIITIAVTIFAFLGTGCGLKELNQSEQNDKEVTEGNNRIASVNSLKSDLNSNYRINLDPLFEVEPVVATVAKWDWTAYSDADLVKIKSELADVQGHVNRVLEISGHSGIILIGTGDLDTERTNAKLYLDSLNAFQGHKKASASPAL